MIILSLFDGMSCGQIALTELGIKIDKYYSSETDKFCIKQTNYMFPNTIQLGNIKKIKATNLDKIDLLIGGSPCQGFSFAGKQLNFKDHRSILFFEFVRLWNEVKGLNPEAKFLFENVNMKKEWLQIISGQLGIIPICINSSLVSAQIRMRWYWTNIRTRKSNGLFYNDIFSDIPQPIDKKILLNDILESSYSDRVKSYCIDANYSRDVNFNYYKRKKRRQVVCLDKCGCITTDGMLVTTKRKRDENGNALVTQLSEKKIRKLSIVECCRLQTIPEWYKWHPEISDTQKYKMLGNGWTIEVIKHIFSFLAK